jgi:methylase of polypeptide subunit release factors
MKGHVPTPDGLADKMVEKLFENNPPEEGDQILYPGCGTGPFISAVYRYCEERDLAPPEGVGIELNPEHLESAREKHKGDNVEFFERDFLTSVEDLDQFEYIIGNPPYVPIEGLDEGEKKKYKRNFETAAGRFDLYTLFLEQAVNLLENDGRLCFVTPEKFEYTETTSPLRKLLAENHIEEIHHIAEDSFGNLVTYPTITTIRNSDPGKTRIITRDGNTREVTLPDDGSSWASIVRGGAPDLDTGVTLGDVCDRISCGVATGADNVFVMKEE